MSDDEIDAGMPGAPMDEFERELYADDEDGVEEDAAKKTKVAQRKSEDEDEEDEEEPGDYDEDEEEEGDEEEDTGRPKKKTKHRHKRPAVNRFLDLEVEVDSDEDEEEDDEEYGRDEFIAEPGVEGDDEEEIGRRTAGHARLDRRERELDDQDLAKIAQDLKDRYGRATVRYTGDMNEVPQRLLMPSVHDASLWQVRVKPGRERDLVFSLMRKALDVEFTARPLAILSAFQRDSLPGMIYVEARSSQQVSQACQGLVGIYPSRGISLVPIEEMASLLQIKKHHYNIAIGGWVRIKRGKYAGDLAQIVDKNGNGEEVGLKFIPRIDFNPKDEGGLEGKKRKKIGNGPTNMRPPQNPFNYEEVVKVYTRKAVAKRGHEFVFGGETYKDGFMEKDFKITNLQLDDISPTLDEIAQFTRSHDGETEGFDLSVIAEASRKAAVLVLQPGDHVEVFEGEQSGVHGVVDSINQDVVTITAIGMDIDGQKVDVAARSVRKKFKAGDHVKVMTGQNADETGLVVNVADNIVTFLSDMSMNEVQVFSKDLREAAEVGSGTNTVGNYELHDLVQLDLQTVGVIFKTERDSFRVLDQNGQVRLVQPHQISMRRDSHRATATDAEGHEVRVNDNMKEVDGEGRKGIVLHIHQSFFAFLHNRDVLENGGIFITRARSLVSLAPKGNIVKNNLDLTKMNPAMASPTGGMVGSGNMGRGPRDRIIGSLIIIVKGPHKGYAGSVKDTNGPIARIELLAGNKVITVDKDKIRIKLPDGKLIKVEDFGGGPRTGGPRNGGGGGGGGGGAFGNSAPKTPGWGAGANTSRTPNPYATEGRTPAWNAASRTPNPYAADGGKTPAWNASSRTPNPYAAEGGRTPAWNTSSRTPNPYASGNATAGAGGTWGGATPKPAGAWGDGASASWGGSSPQWNQTYNAPTPAASAPTPAAAPTPGASWSSSSPWGSAPTPGAHSAWDSYASAATPAFGAPTPGNSGMGGATYGASGLPTFVPPELWLLDLAFKGKNTIVSIGPNASSSWQDGEEDDRQGYVQSVFDPRNDVAARTAQFIPLDSVGDTLTVPIKYLVPVHPGAVNDLACVLEGPHKGAEVILREAGFGAQWTVGPFQNPNIGFFDIESDRMVKIYRPPQ